MASAFVLRQIDRLLDEAGEAISQLVWGVVNKRAQAVLALDPENVDGVALLAASERALIDTFNKSLRRSPLHRNFFQCERQLTGHIEKTKPLSIR